MTEKRCGTCGVTKPLEGFNRHARTVDGRQGRCRDCAKSAYHADPLPAKLASRRFKLRQFDMTEDEYDELLAYQGGSCWICQKKPQKGGKRLAVDHEHRTGLIRGLLCHTCNQMLGFMHENARLFARAAGYLDHPPALNVFRPPKRHRKAPPQTAEEARTIMEEQ